MDEQEEHKSYKGFRIIYIMENKDSILYIAIRLNID